MTLRSPQCASWDVVLQSHHYVAWVIMILLSISVLLGAAYWFAWRRSNIKCQVIETRVGETCFRHQCLTPPPCSPSRPSNIECQLCNLSFSPDQIRDSQGATSAMQGAYCLTGHQCLTPLPCSPSRPSNIKCQVCNLSLSHQTRSL